MKLDTGLATRNLREVPEIARAAEDAGFDAIWVPEAGNDGFLPAALIAEHTKRIKTGTSVAIAFPRSPMVTAYTAWDLAGLSQGRFMLGLGTQVKGHIERRFSVKWDEPVPRLREYIQSLRAIFKCWSEGCSKLSFKGKYYNFSLMTPFFTPPPHNYSNIPIYIAGVNEYICRLAGELCDGLHAHPFNSPKYLREFVIPNVEKGLAKAGRSRKDFTMATTAFVIVGNNKDEIERARAGIRQQISFYASTRTYKVVLETHGWGEVCDRLNAMAAKGDWAAMGQQITDEMLDVYTVSGTFDDIADKVHERYDGLLDRVAFYIPYHAGIDDAQWRKLAKRFNG
ncbi:MAG TPA: TIGR03617 family F420-dependent LLM class oxidoreductase [Candidatus Binataceae bacterium]|nr:TIGR03617 family F420-dependent LLM class oxidoreductase [Candidatus Binataceae bacterium]